jgi:uncharacterized protein (TIGR03435 family)
MRIRAAVALAIPFALSICALGFRCVHAQDAQNRVSPETAAAGASQMPPAAANDGEFETISIKVNNSGSGRHSADWDLAGGRLRAVNFSLAGFMVYAFQLPANRIVGAPDWFDSEFFDIDATAATPDNSTDNRDRIQAMLADRFKLAAHRETRDLPVYALVLERPGTFGPRLKLTDANCSNRHATDLSKPNAASTANTTPDDVNCGDTSGNAATHARYLGHGVSMEKLLEVLSGPPSHAFVERPIVDRTGITSKIDFTLEFTPAQFAPRNDAPPDPSALPSFTTALSEELGLKLESAMAPIDVLVIDHVEQPSPN